VNVETRTLVAVAAVATGVAVAWRPAATLLAGSVEFVGPGVAVPATAVAIGAAFVASGVLLLGRRER
jgi:hypothetical protein